MNDLTPMFAQQIDEMRRASEADAIAKEEVRRAAVTRSNVRGWGNSLAATEGHFFRMN